MNEERGGEGIEEETPGSDGRTRDSGVDRRAVLGSVGVAVAASTAGCFANESGAGETTTDDGGNAVEVGPGGSYAYEPEAVTVGVGETVTWTWDSPNHNIVVSELPEDASWSGTDGDASTTYDAPHTYEFTFDTPGTYEYYCQPHEGLGMVGTVVVEE